MTNTFIVRSSFSEMAGVCNFSQVVLEACDRVASGEYKINVLYVEQFGSRE